MVLPPAHRGSRSLVLALLAPLAAACASHPAHAPRSALTPPPTQSVAPATPHASPVPELRVGTPVERELSSGEAHAYSVTVGAGEYLRIAARPRAMDIALRLLGPDGATLAEADGPGGSKERELLSLVTSVTGACRLLVIRRDAGEPRPYKVELQERRAGLPSDGTQVQAERAFSEGLHRLALGTDDDLQRATRQFEQSLALWRTIEDRSGEVDCLNHLGVVLYFRGGARDAIVYYDQARSLAESTGYRRGLGEALNNLGAAYARLADREATLRFYQSALVVWREIGDTAESARTWHNLGWFYLNRGEALPALDSLNKALELRQADHDVAGEAFTLQALGTLNLMLLGETGAALEYFSRALPLSRAAGNLRLEAFLLSSLPAVHRQRGDLQQALQLYQAASERFEALGDTTSLANVVEALAGLYIDLGDFERAASQYQRVLRIYRDQGNREFEARALSSMGLTDFRRGDPRAALAAYGEALEVSRAIGNRSTEITTLHRRAIAEHAIGDLRAAQAHLEACLRLQDATGNHRERAGILLELGSVLGDLGDADAAVKRFAEALDLAHRTEQLAVQSAVLLRWSELERDQGRLEAARKMMDQAVGIVESVRRGLVQQDFRETYFASRRSFYDVYVDLLMRLEAANPGQGNAEQAFTVSERSRARGLAELLAEGRIDVRTGIAAEFRERETRIGVQISKAQSALLEEGSREPRDETKIAKLEGELDGILEERERLEAEIRVRHPRYAEVRYPASLSVADVQRTLDPRTAFLEYAIGPEASFLFVITDREFRSFRLHRTHDIQSEVERFRQALARPERRLQGQFQQSAYELYSILVAPADELLHTKQKWIIAPDGAAHLLPFEALLTKPPDPALALQDLAYLVRSHSILYTPSAGVLRGLRFDEAGKRARDTADGPSFVAFADPVYAGSKSPAESLRSEGNARLPLPELPETRREVEAIAGLYPPNEVALYLGPDATEDNVKAGKLSSARRIHFAVHGLLDEIRPELSGLVLSRNGKSSEDGILQAYEIFNLDLEADLVVLSACETGLGKQLAGEGLVGLSRAFFYAGAPSLVVSLWRVADASTADIMIEFHRRLNLGEEKSEALRGAKLQALLSPRLGHPFHWASFILVGDG